MARKRFVDTLDGVLKKTPRESVKGTVVVDQVYARYQHENPQFFHPDGGKAFYLRDPLYHNVNRYMRHLGEESVEGDVVEAMADNMEDLTLGVRNEAPLDFHDLKSSGHPIVEADGQVRYDRPAEVGRLSEAELRAKGRLSRLLDPDRYKR